MIPAPPRELTPTLRRRAWADPVVRFWWLCAVVLLAIAIYIGGTQYWEFQRLSRAINSGISVAARIDSIEADRRVGRNVPPGAGIALTYQYQDHSYLVSGTMPGSTFHKVGDSIPIHIDPKDPTNWTTDDRPPSLAVSLIGAILLLPVAAGAGLFALLLRARVLRTCRDGKAIEAVVTQNRQSPLAPRGRSIRCSAAAGGRVVEVFVPAHFSSLGAGDTLAILLPPGRGRPLAAAWFEPTTT